jgi:agmatinase
MIDPVGRWKAHGYKPGYAGLPSFASRPWTEDPNDLAGADVAIVGAPTDDLVSHRPGTRFGPRAIRAAGGAPGTHLEANVDWGAVLGVVDFGDAPVIPADPVRSHAAIERIVREVIERGVLPIVLGGDHSISEPDIRACASRHGRLGVLHFDTHTDTAADAWGSALSHGTPFYRLVEAGVVDPHRYVQIGLRGYWPGPAELAWQRAAGVTSFFMHDVRRLGIDAVVAQAVEHVGTGPVFLTVDVDVLDPTVAAGTGTPEPGGMNAGELLTAVRTVASAVELVGADVVEVLPLSSAGDDITALVANRIVCEVLSGLALARLQHVE